MGVRRARDGALSAVKYSAVPLVVALVSAGCGGEEPGRGVDLFESGTLQRLELDGRVSVGDEVDDDDAAAAYTVMCLWATSEHGPLSIIPGPDEADEAGLRDIQIFFDRESLGLTSVALRVGDDWTSWEAGDGAEPPVFRVGGPEFSLDGTLTGTAATHRLGVAGTCETAFD